MTNEKMNSILQGEPLPPVSLLSMTLPVSRQDGPLWEDVSKLMKVLGYSCHVERLEHEIRLIVTKETH